LVREAKGHGKWAHMGRCNSGRRLAAAAGWGYDSADGTKLRYAIHKDLPLVKRWMAARRAQPPLALWG
jgi:hypothetical protein